MSLARTMKRKLEKQAATGGLRAAKGFARARKTVYHATTEEIVRCKKARKETETASMIIMDVAVNRVFGWGKKNAPAAAEEDAHSHGVHQAEVRDGRRDRGYHPGRAQDGLDQRTRCE